MKALTNKDYYDILLQASKEAFENIEYKDFLYTDEAMRESKKIINISHESIEKLGTETTNNVIVNYQTSENITIAFLLYLERQKNKFEKKYLIPRNEFYKRCLTSLNIKLTERNKNVNRKPLRNITSMGATPEPLEFLEYMKWEIQNKTIPVEVIQKPQKKLCDFIHNVENKAEFLKDLKNIFPTEKGKTIKAVVNILKDAGMLIWIDGQFQSFYDLLFLEFGGTIGTYPSINDAGKGNNTFNDEFLNPIRQKLNPLIIKHKIN